MTLMTMRITNGHVLPLKPHCAEKLEELGIGRPSTYAPTIGTVVLWGRSVEKGIKKRGANLWCGYAAK